jgi:hypothetical protein
MSLGRGVRASAGSPEAFTSRDAAERYARDVEDAKSSVPDASQSQAAAAPRTATPQVNESANDERAEQRGTTDAQVVDVLDWLDNALPVASMRGDELNIDQRIKDLARDAAAAWKKEMGGADGVMREEVDGLVVIDERSAHASIGHGANATKKKALYLVPSAMKNARFLGRMPRIKGRPEAFVFAAPVGIGDQTYRMYMEVRKDANMTRLYLHEVVLRKENANLAFEYPAASREGAEPQAAKVGVLRSFLDSLRAVKVRAGVSAAQSGAGYGAEGPVYSQAPGVSDPDTALIEQYANVEGAPTAEQIREARKQYRDAERAYGGQQAWQRARDAGRTKLSYPQWVMVRTPNFKRWFGDWEALRTQQRLDAMEPLRVNVPSEWLRLSKEELRQRVERLLDDAVRDKVSIEHPEFGPIRIGRRGASKTVHASPDPAKLLIAADLSSVIPRAVVGSAEIGNRQGVEAREYLLAKVDVGGTELIATVAVNRQADGRWYYNTTTVSDAQNEGDPRAYASPGAVSSPLSETLLTGVASFIRRPFARVNPDTVSKVIDPDTGEPRVVYHGAGADFNVFDRQRLGENSLANFAGGDPGWLETSRAGFWFSTRSDIADFIAAPRSIQAFLSIRNPMRINSLDDLAQEVRPLGGSGYRALMERQGYDGIVINDEEMGGISYVAFDPAQIKSATGNIGTFDPANPDIRFSAGAPTSGLSVSEAQQAINAALGRRAATVEVVTRDQLQAVRGEPLLTNAEGLFDAQTGRTYLVADGIGPVTHGGEVAMTAPERAAWVAWHELFHRAMAARTGIAGGNGVLPQGAEYAQALSGARSNAWVDKLATAIASQRTGGLAENVATEEALAELNAAIETGNYDQIERQYGVRVPPGTRHGVRGIVTRFIQRLREIIGRLTGARTQGWSDAQVFDFVRQTMREGDAAPGDLTQSPEFARWFGTNDIAELESAYAALTNARGENRTDGGHYIDTDLVRELSPDYRADRSRSQELHPYASALTRALYARALARPVRQGKSPVVAFLAGGGGSGKSTAASDLLADLNPDITFDGTLSNLGNARRDIKAALASGRGVRVVFVYRSPGRSAEGAVGRAIRAGRPVPVWALAEAHARAPQVVKTLAKEYNGDDRVQVRAINNDGGFGSHYEIPVQEIPDVDENEAERTFRAAVERAKAEGRLSENLYASFTAGRRLADQGLGAPQSANPGNAARNAVNSLRPGLAQGELDGQPYTPEREALTADERQLILDAFRAEGGNAQNIGDVESSTDIAAKSAALRALAEREGYRMTGRSGGGKYMRLARGDVSIPARVSDHANVNRSDHFKESAINIAPDEGQYGPAFDTFESALWKLRNAGVSAPSESDPIGGDLTFGGDEAVYFSLSPVEDALDFTKSGKAKPTTLIGTLGNVRNPSQLRQQASSALERLNIAIHDGLIPVRRWAESLPVDDALREQIVSGLYRGDGVRNALMQEAEDKFGNDILKGVRAIAHTHKMDIETAQQLVGYWLTADYAPNANDWLLQKDTTALNVAQASGDAAAITKAQDQLDARDSAVHDPNTRNVTRSVGVALDHARRSCWRGPCSARAVTVRPIAAACPSPGHPCSRGPRSMRASVGALAERNFAPSAGA